jgi:hypothetical protein
MKRVTQKISFVVIAFIVINYLAVISNDVIYKQIVGTYNHTLNNWTNRIIPAMFLFGCCILLLVALVWICHSLRHDPQLMGNERWMAVHAILLIMVLGSYIYFVFLV